MLFVNYLGDFHSVPAVFRHHNTYCSYADTIMPQFFFAVGFAYRLTFLRRLRTVGLLGATAAALRRNFGLILLGLVFHHLDGGVKTWAELRALGTAGFLATAFQREPFQTLIHIALTSIWILPVIAARPTVRVVFLIASGALHLWLSQRFYFDWVWTRPGIDGGPLGFLTWTIPTLVGSLAYDAVAKGGEALLRRLLLWSALLMGLAYALSCLGGGGTIAALPFFAPESPVNLWTMSQRTGSLTYLTFSAGFSLAVYAGFVVLSDRHEIRPALFRTFGQNALVAYILHPIVATSIKPYVPLDSPGWYILASVLLYFAVNWLFIRSLEKNGVFIKL